jgi:hypothetical protein
MTIVIYWGPKKPFRFGRVFIHIGMPQLIMIA